MGCGPGGRVGGRPEREFPCSVNWCSALVLPLSASGKAASGVVDKY